MNTALIRGTFECPPIIVSNDVAAVPVVGWEAPSALSNLEEVRVELLGVLVSVAGGMSWTGTGVDRSHFPGAELCPPPGEARALCERAFEAVAEQDGVLIRARSATVEHGEHAAIAGTDRRAWEIRVGRDGRVHSL